MLAPSDVRRDRDEASSVRTAGGKRRIERPIDEGSSDHSLATRRMVVSETTLTPGGV
jgi:hypothetical protein